MMKSLSFQVAFILVLLFQFGQSVTDIKAIQGIMKSNATVQGGITGGDENCELGKAAACDTLCMVVIPYYLYGPFRAGCLDGNDVCWCCDPSFDSGGSLVICPSDEYTNCNYGCHQFAVTDVSGCSHAGYGSGGGYSSGGGYGGGASNGGGYGGGSVSGGGGYSSGGGGGGYSSGGGGGGYTSGGY